MLITFIASLLILQNINGTSDEDLVQSMGNCCIFNFVEKEVKDYICGNSAKQRSHLSCSSSSIIKEYPKCHHLEDLTFYPAGCQETNSGCLLITESNKYTEARCPYNYATTEKVEIPIWYPAKRNTQRGIGEFMMEEIGTSYGNIIKDYEYKYPKSIIWSNCMVLEDGKKLAVPCDEMYNRSCKYKSLQKNNLGYCNALIPNCFNANFDTSSLKCLCKRVISQVTLENTLMNSKLCLNISQTYLSNLEVLHLSIESESSDVEGTIINNLECNYCESNFPYKLPNYTFENDNGVLKLKFYNKDNLVTTGYGRIFCMTDAYEDVLIKKLLTTETEKNNSINVYIVPITSGHYWCEAFEVKNFNKLVTQEIWVYRDNVYPMEITVRFKYGEDPSHSDIAYLKYILSLEELYNSRYSHISKDVRFKWMKTIEINEIYRHVTYLLHICALFGWDEHEANYNELKKNIPGVLSAKHFIYKHSELYSSLFCMEGETIQGDLRLTWPKTLIEHSANPKERCLKADGTPVTRKCGGNYFDGGRWEDVPNCVMETTIESHITKNLSDVLHSNFTTPEIIHNLTELTENTNDFEPIDVYLVSSILAKVNPEEVDLENITLIVNNIMLTNQDTLKTSQSKFNATDRILYSFDLMLNTNKYLLTDHLIETDNLISFTFDCNLTDYNGLALIRNDEDFTVLKLRRSDRLEEVITKLGLEVVTYLPDILLEYLASEHPKIVINIFLNDVLFNDNTKKSVARNFGILLDEKKKLPDNITLLFKPEQNITKGACGFWNYGFDNDDPIFGKWSIDNDSEIYENFQRCEYWHITHFGLLITDKNIVKDTVVLEVITDVECALSLIGFFGIFTTAALFKTWRDNRGNRFLLHYSFVSCLQIILLYFSQVVYKEESFFLCVVIGAALHYTLLSQFGWMLVVSYLQYKRYVTVFLGSQKFMLIKSFIISYFFPTIPVTLLLVFHMKNYTEGTGGICYPTGYGLMFGILIPISVVVIANIIIFARIILELFCFRKNKCVDDDIFLLRLRLVVFLFFMLGITWVLGFAAQIFESPTFLYAFCSTASLQGFVIFIFFIVCNKNARIMYVYMFRKYNYT